MVECAVAGVPPLTVDDRELQRDKPSYTIDTLESMRAELAAETRLFLLLGWDAFCGLPTWHRWEELLQHCHILVLQRPDADSETAGCLAQPAGSAFGERPAGPERAGRTDCIRLADTARGFRHPDPSTAGQR